MQDSENVLPFVEDKKNSGINSFSDRDFYRVPCVHESSEILMSDNRFCLARDIMVGNEVMTSQGSAKIILIIETMLTEPTEMVQIGRLSITPTHPIKFNNQWILPKDHPYRVNYIMNDFNKVYTFALEKDHSMFINGFEVIGLGHGIEDFIIKNSYLGSRKIVEDLSLIADFDRVVRFNSGDFLIHKNTGNVSIDPQFYLRNRKSGDFT